MDWKGGTGRTSPGGALPATPARLMEVLDRLQTVPGVLACGVCFSNKMVVYRTQAGYPMTRDQAKFVWRSVKETFDHLQDQHLAADRLRWCFGNFNLQAMYRKSMVIGVMVERSLSDDTVTQIEEHLATACGTDVETLTRSA